MYFDDDGGLLSLASIVDGSEVDFEQGATPPVLPSGNQASPGFEVTAGLSAGAAPPGRLGDTRSAQPPTDAYG